MAQTFKVSFTLDESDADYFRTLYRKARRNAAGQSPEQIVKDARGIVAEVHKSKKTPNFVREAIASLADLTDLIQDDEYDAPKSVRDAVLAGISYFSAPEDLIPDSVPGLGFLDDAIMVKFIEEEFKHELWGYRKFRKLRDVSEQRPWQSPAKTRLQGRLEADRKRIRAEIAKRQAKEEAKKKTGSYLGW